MSSPGTSAPPDKVISDLRQQLKRVSQHRDELERDVENLCMQNDSSSIFSSSMIVSERIFSTEKELSKTKSQLEAVLGERDSLRDDLRHHKGKLYGQLIAVPRDGQTSSHLTGGHSTFEICLF